MMMLASVLVLLYSIDIFVLEDEKKASLAAFSQCSCLLHLFSKLFTLFPDPPRLLVVSY